MNNPGNCKIQQETQVERELNIGNKVCEELIDVVTTLEDRLRKALRNDPEVDDNADVRCEMEIVPLASHIRSIHNNVADQIQRIRNLLNQLEL